MKKLFERNFYDLLEITPTATVGEIRRAYEGAKENLANQTLYTQAEQGRIFERLEEAFAVLSEPERRRRYDYDLALSQGEEKGGAERPEREADPEKTPKAEGAFEAAEGEVEGGREEPLASDIGEAGYAGEASGDDEQGSPGEGDFPGAEEKDRSHPDDRPEENRAAAEIPEPAGEEAPPDGEERDGEKIAPVEEALYYGSREEDYSDGDDEITPPPKPPPPDPAEYFKSDRDCHGGTLRAYREALGVELKDISRETKISMYNLILLENSDYLAMPAPVYVKGYLRSYCKLLDLDAEQVAPRYMESYSRAREETTKKD